MAPPPVPSKQKLIVWTGGSSGLGYAAIENLLSSGESYHIILGSRAPLDSTRSRHIQPLLASSKSTLDRYECDLSKYKSIRKFAETVLAKHTQPIDAFVLCAGMIAYNHRLTADGEDEAVQVNVLSQALLIDLFEKRLGEGGHPCRILFVGSSQHREVLPGTVTVDNLDEIITKEYDGKPVYNITKFIQVYLMYMTQERFASKPSVTVVIVSPGFVPDTGLGRELGLLKHGLMRFVLPQTPFATTIPDAGKTIVRGITENFPSGTYFSQRKIEETAEDTYHEDLREQWSQWFLSKKIWHLADKPAPTATTTAPVPELTPAPVAAGVPAPAPAAPAVPTPAPTPATTSQVPAEAVVKPAVAAAVAAQDVEAVTKSLETVTLAPTATTALPAPTVATATTTASATEPPPAPSASG